MQIIDPHIHLFARQTGHYRWLNPQNPPFWPDKEVINRDFNAGDLILPAGLQHSGFVHIEAGFDNLQPWRELAWLEASQKGNFKTIASINLTLETSEFAALLDKLALHSSLIGVRQILDQDAQTLLADPQVQRNLREIAERGLIFECQLDAGDTPAIDLLVTVLLQLPKLLLVINHAAFPAFQQTNFSIWQQNIGKLAAFKHVSIKASGWEMVDRKYQSEHIQQIVDVLLALFSDKKIMLASNFPLCLFSNSYAQLWHLYNNLALSKAQKSALMYDNAKRIYQF